MSGPDQPHSKLPTNRVEPYTGERPHFATRVIHAGQAPDPATGAVMPPIYTSSTYKQQSPGVHLGLDYGRSHNPTRWAFERCVADLEDGKIGFAFASGLAATATVLELLEHGSHIIAGDDLYGGTFRLFERVRRNSAGLDISYVDTTNLLAIEKAIRPNTGMLWVESPSNPLLKLADLAALAQIARKHRIIPVADNTFATPYIQRPLNLGFEIVVHSVTKYINGHSDMIGGMAIVGDNAELAERLGFLQNAAGAISGPFDCFLALRGVKTLALRMERATSNALEIARHLESHPAIKRVSYPGLPSHPQHELARRQMTSGGGMVTRGPPRRAGESTSVSRALRIIHTRRKSWRRRESYRAPRDHDPRQHPSRPTRRNRHRRRAGAPVGRRGGRTGSDRGS